MAQLIRLIKMSVVMPLWLLCLCLIGLILIFSLCVGLHNKNALIPVNSTVLSLPSPKSVARDPFTQPQIIRGSEDKEIIVGEYNSQEAIPILYKYDGKEVLLTTGYMPVNVQWSPDLKRIAYIDGGMSMGQTVTIINVDTKEVVPLGTEQTLLRNTPTKYPSVYDHIYSANVEWYSNTELIVRVNGSRLTDGSFEPAPQYYLINAEDGKIIKRLL